MLSPLPNSHRRNPRKLGRGQYPRPRPVTTSILNSGPNVTLAFSAPVIIHARLDLRIDARTFVSQTINTPTRVTQVFNADVSSQGFVFAPTTDAITTPSGAQVIGESGAFMLNPDNVLHSAGGNYYPPATTDVKLGVQFGVSNTGSTGSYNPAPPPLVVTLSVVDTLDGNYTVQFSQNLTSVVSGTDAGMTMYNPASHLWESVYCVQQLAADTIQVSPASAIPGFTLFLIAAQPSQLLAAAPFAASPLISIT